MLAYLVKRAVMSLVIIFVVISLSFFMIRLMPGNAMDFLYNQLVSQGGLTPQEIQQKIHAIYGLTPKGSVWSQYVQYIGNIAHGNFGNSIVSPGKSVSGIIASSLPWTIFIVAFSLLISFAIGI